MTGYEWRRDVDAVQSLGEELGWGHLMELAAALWAMDAREDNCPDAGCFVPVCLSQVDSAVREDAQHEREMYIWAIQNARDET